MGGIWLHTASLGGAGGERNMDSPVAGMQGSLGKAFVSLEGRGQVYRDFRRKMSLVSVFTHAELLGLRCWFLLIRIHWELFNRIFSF